MCHSTQSRHRNLGGAMMARPVIRIAGTLATVVAVVLGIQSAAQAAPTTVFVSAANQSGTTACLHTPVHTIQTGVDRVAPGGVVIVCPATYSDGALIGKPLTLRGQRGAVIDAPDASTAILITAGHVTVTGLEIHNTAANNTGCCIGPAIDASREPGILATTITGNLFSNNLSGDIWATGRGLVVEGNRSRGSGGFWLQSLVDSRVVDNEIRGVSGDGILIETSEGSLIQGNTVTDSWGTGLRLSTDSGAPLRNNRIISNVLTGNGVGGSAQSGGAGIALNVNSANTDASGNIISGNAISKNKGGGPGDDLKPTGIYLGSASPMTIGIRDNKISNETVGVFKAGPVTLRRSNNVFLNVPHRYRSIPAYPFPLS